MLSVFSLLSFVILVEGIADGMCCCDFMMYSSVSLSMRVSHFIFVFYFCSGANVLACTIQKETPLMLAANNGYLNVVRYLVEKTDAGDLFDDQSYQKKQEALRQARGDEFDEKEAEESSEEEIEIEIDEDHPDYVPSEDEELEPIPDDIDDDDAQGQQQQQGQSPDGLDVVVKKKREKKKKIITKRVKKPKGARNRPPPDVHLAGGVEALRRYEAERKAEEIIEKHLVLAAAQEKKGLEQRVRKNTEPVPEAQVSLSLMS